MTDRIDRELTRASLVECAARGCRVPWPHSHFDPWQPCSDCDSPRCNAETGCARDAYRRYLDSPGA